MEKNLFCRDIRIDVSTSCNLSCPLCPHTPRREKQSEKKHMMSPDSFKLLADNFDFCPEKISFGAKHEPLVNRDIFKMIKYINVKYPGVSVSLLSNFNCIYEASEIADSGVSEIVVGLDGTDQESYSKYRTGGNFNTVISNIKKLQEYKKNKNIEKPYITISFIVFSHNEHLISKAKKFFESMGVNIFFRCTDRYDGYEDWYPKNFHNERYDSEKKDAGMLCTDPFEILNIDALGNVYPCCAEEALNYNIGNIFNCRLSEIWNGEKINFIRKFLKDGLLKKDIPCISCPVYKNNGYTSYDKFGN